MSLITDLNTLWIPTRYIFMLIESRGFDINRSYNSLEVGRFDRINTIAGEFIKIGVKDLIKWNRERIQQVEYWADDIRVFNIPTNDREYTNFVNLIESYKRGRQIDVISRQIIEKLKDGTSTINVNHLHYLQPEAQQEAQPEAQQEAQQKAHPEAQPEAHPEAQPEAQPEHIEDCPICLEPLNNTAITTRCGHRFHTECMRHLRRNVCPICRQKPTPYKGGKLKRNTRKVAKRKNISYKDKKLKRKSVKRNLRNFKN